jgi:hypothetical protein
VLDREGRGKHARFCSRSLKKGEDTEEQIQNARIILNIYILKRTGGRALDSVVQDRKE